MRKINRGNKFSAKRQIAEAAAVKKAIIFGAFVLVSAIFIFLLYPPELNMKDCQSDRPQNCGCPAEIASMQGSKSIVFIDATDPIPPSKLQDIKEILNSFTAAKSFFNSALHRFDRVSIYAYSNQRGQDLVPLASFCRLPSSFILGLRVSQSDVGKYQNQINNVVKEAEDIAKKYQGGGHSNLLEAISIVTGSGAYWNKQGKFIFISDLIERSSECGYFDRNDPQFANTGSACRNYITRASENMRGANSYVCLIERSENPLRPSVSKFWQEYFQTATSIPATKTCDPTSILTNIQ